MTTYTYADDPDMAIDFGGVLVSERWMARVRAQKESDANGAPVAVWERDGWYTICDVPPDMISPDPEACGWTLVALVSPRD